MATSDLELRCQPDGDNWICQVTVGDDPAATRHTVEVPRECLETLDPGAASPDRLVETSFHFLLEREPREAIMSRFELPLITRFFPEWEAEMGRRLGS
jgi:hypothetical protein